MAPCVAIRVPVAGHLWQWGNGAANALNEGGLGRGHQMETSAERGNNSNNSALFRLAPRLSPATKVGIAAPETARSKSSTPADAVAIGEGETLGFQRQEERQRERCSPLGCMFRPELTKDGVLAIVSQVLCRPGFTLGPSDERRLLKSVRTGRIDIRTMSRILRWLAGERVTCELRRRGIEFVGPKQATASSPYTTGQGMTQLVKEIIARNGAGTRFIVCFSSRFDACSSAIAGVLVDAASTASGLTFDCSCPRSGPVAIAGCGGGAISADARTVSTCSSFSDTEDDQDQTAPCSTLISVELVPEPRRTAAPKGAGGTLPGARSRFVSGVGANPSGISAGGNRISTERASDGGDGGNPGGGVVALLSDEKPKHRLCKGGDGNSGGSRGTAGFGEGGGGRVYGMPVQEWVEAYGDCDGPMLAAWVFPGHGHHE